MDASTGDAIKTWRFSNMKQWNVNWEIKMVGNPHNSFAFSITFLKILLEYGRHTESIRYKINTVL